MTNHAMIIGGGIAGPVTAMALERVGIPSVIFEAHPRGSDDAGAFLTLAVNGLEALDLIGLRDAVVGLGMDTPRMKLISGRGKELGAFPMPARTVQRGELYQVLRDEAVRRGAELRYGKRLEDAEPTPDGVEARFADGTSAEGAMLVGADGLRSRTRQIIDPKAPTARHIGLLNVGGFAHGLALDGEPGTAHFVFGRRCFFGYFIHPDGDVWWFANPPSRTEPTSEQMRAVSSDEWRGRLTRLLSGDTGPMLEIVEATERILPGWNTYDFPSVPRWHNDRMVIIGDAVHAASPSSGQGASMAIEDAVVLATCLRDLPEPAEAFAAFEGLRRERVERVVRHGKRSGDGKAAGAVGARIRDAVLPVIIRRMVDGHRLDWIYEHRIDWDARVAAR